MMFVPTEPVPVSDGENTIFIRPKMGRGVEALVASDFSELGGRSQMAYDLCLLRHNIVRWEGPAFTDDNGKPILPTRQNIDRLDSFEPLVDKVLQKIAELNRKPSAVAAPNLNGKIEHPTPAANA